MIDYDAQIDHHISTITRDVEYLKAELENKHYRDATWTVRSLRKIMDDMFEVLVRADMARYLAREPLPFDGEEMEDEDEREDQEIIGD